MATAHPLSLVCLRPRWADDVDADVATMTLLERLNDGGEVFLTHTTVRGQAVLRVAIGAPATTRAHVERVWALLREGHDWLAADFAGGRRRARRPSRPSGPRRRRVRAVQEAERQDGIEGADAEPAPAGPEDAPEPAPADA